MEQAFKEYLDDEYPIGAKRTRSAIICRNYADRIVQFLKNTSGESDKIFRHLVKRNGFQLLDLPEAGLRDVLVVKIKEKSSQDLFGDTNVSNKAYQIISWHNSCS